MNSISLYLSPYYATKQAVIEGKADLGICYDEEERDDRLSIHSLGHVNLVLVSSSKLVERMGKDKLDFNSHNVHIDTSFVIDEPDGIFRKQFEKYIKDNNITLNST